MARRQVLHIQPQANAQTRIAQAPVGPGKKLIKRLPRYFALKDGEEYLGLTRDFDEWNGGWIAGSLEFSHSAEGMSRMATHEVVYDKDEEGVAAFQAANGRYWRAVDGIIIADKDGAPDNKDCYFNFEVLSDGQVKITPKNSDQLLVPATGLFPKPSSSHAGKFVSPQMRLNSVLPQLRMGIQFVDAKETAVKIPSYIFLKNGDNTYLSLHKEKKEDIWLQFNTKEKNIRCAFAVIPLIDGMVAIQSVASGKFWRDSTTWIWADVGNLSNAQADVFCHFEPFKLGDTLIAFKSVVYDFLRMYTDDDWTASLNANGAKTDTLLTMENASNRSISDIHFLMHLAEMVDGPAVVVAGSSTVQNDTNDMKVEMQTTVSIVNAKTTSRSIETSSTFKMEIATKASAGVPEVVNIESELRIGTESSWTTVNGTQDTEAVTYQTAYTVKDIPPKSKVRLDVRCLRAKFNIPFTYTNKTVRFDGVDLGITQGVDGIFERVSVVDVEAVAYQISQPATSDSKLITIDTTKTAGKLHPFVGPGTGTGPVIFGPH